MAAGPAMWREVASPCRFEREVRSGSAPVHAHVFERLCPECAQPSSLHGLIREALECVECGRKQRAGEPGWKAYLTTDEDEPAEAVVYCAEGAEREFGK